MKKPNLFIVGAARSGTTALWKYLKSQPEIYMTDDELLKEPSFFSDIKKGMDLNAYLKIFEKADLSHKYVGDASVAYLTDPKSAERIYNFNPDAKILILLRNPADRAYSLYNWMVQDGYEYAPSFEEALEMEETRVNRIESDWFRPNYYWGYMYFRSGLYYNQVKKYLEFFKDNTYIIKFEDFRENPFNTFQNVCSFLRIEVNIKNFKIYNRSVSVHSPKIQFILRKLNNYIQIKNNQGNTLRSIRENVGSQSQEIMNKFFTIATLSIYEKVLIYIAIIKVKHYLNSFSDQFIYKRVMKKRIRDRILEFGYKKGKSLKKNSGTHNALIIKYKNDIEELSSLTGINFIQWLEKY